LSKTEEEKANYIGLLDLLTTIIKAYCTDKGLLVCSMAMDVTAAMVSVQNTRWNNICVMKKIACIYEGTNGIQSLTLVARGLGQRKGANLMNMAGIIQANIAKLKSHPVLGKHTAILEEAAGACLDITKFFTQVSKAGEFLIPVLNAYRFMEIFGDVLVGNFLLHGGSIADEKLRAIYQTKGADTPEKQKVLLKDDKEAAFYSGRVASGTILCRGDFDDGKISL